MNQILERADLIDHVIQKLGGKVGDDKKAKELSSLVAYDNGKDGVKNYPVNMLSPEATLQTLRETLQNDKPFPVSTMATMKRLIFTSELGAILNHSGRKTLSKWLVAEGRTVQARLMTTDEIAQMKEHNKSKVKTDDNSVLEKMQKMKGQKGKKGDKGSHLVQW